ncbi:TadE/TadG family type IV pilus assembly protein [Pseudomonas fildesensis]|uniref:TadE/TadG family type IV pilus assembly protein n=1 Tax=Pseudomonas fildesensis TaxID=1674920 RepID=UPI00387B4D44
MKSGLPGKQKGAVAIEFAVVFVIFFAVFYGLISYSLPLLLMQSFNHAAAEGVRRSVALDPATPDYPNQLILRAKSAAQAQLNWIPTTFQFLPEHITATYDGTTLSLQIKYPSAKLRGVLPVLVLPGIGAVPNLPTHLTAQSSIRF